VQKLTKGSFNLGPKIDMPPTERAKQVAEHYSSRGLCASCGGSGTISGRETVEPVPGTIYESIFMAGPCEDCGGTGKVGGVEAEIARRLKRSGLPMQMHAWTFESWDTHTNPSMQPVFAEMRRWAQHTEGSLVLQGLTGLGKTHLAAAATIHLLSTGLHVRFTTAKELLLDLQHAISGDRDYQVVYDGYCQAQVLVLDEYGGERDTAYANDVLEGIITYRYAREMPFILTTNMDVTQIPDRMLSRFSDGRTVKILPCEGDDYRRMQR
jgi:DNA replication protein DnaC